MDFKSMVFLLASYFTAAAGVFEFHESEGNATFYRNRGNGRHGNLQNSPPTPPQCVTPQGPCACQTDRGLIDLSPIDSKDGSQPYFDNVPSNFGRTFIKYNPCTVINTDACRGAAICRCYNQWYCVAIGVHSSAQFKTDAVTQKMTISYTSGEFCVSIVTLTCDEAQEGTLTVDSSTNPYKFTLTSKYACPSNPADGGPAASGSEQF